MISEKAFIGNFSSYWRSLLPLSDDFVRYLNKEQNYFYERVSGLVLPGRRALVNEVSFLILQDWFKSESFLGTISPTPQQLSNYEEVALRKVSNIMFDSEQERLNYFEVEEAIQLAKWMKQFLQCYHPSDEKLIFSPKFKGCGFVSACEGDVLVGDTLYEIKAGDRAFRTIDLRQVITYCTLNYASSQYDIKRVGIVNPRQGTFFTLDIDDLARSVCGKSANELFLEIIHFISSSGVSK